MQPRTAPRPLPKTIGGALVALLIGGVLAVLLYRTMEVPYEPLFGTLRPNEAVRIIEHLEALNADYRFEPGGVIAVPRSDAGYLRRELGRLGMPDVSGALPARPLPDRLQTRLVQWSLIVLLGMVSAWFLLALRSLLRDLKRREGAAGPLRTIPVNTGCATEEQGGVDLLQKNAGPDVPTLALLLREEHPQVVAVYLLSLPAERSAAVLDLLTPATRDDVWRRMATMGSCDEALREAVAALFDAKAAEYAPGSGSAFEKAAAVFERFSPGVRREMFRSMAMDDTRFCRQVLPQLLRREDLFFLDGETWSDLIAPFSRAELNAAFSGEEEALTERFFDTMTPIKTDEENSPAVNSADVRQRLLSRAKMMAAQGTLHWAAD